MGSRPWPFGDVIGYVTIRLPGVDFLWVVHGDHASIWHRYEDMAKIKERKDNKKTKKFQPKRMRNALLEQNADFVHLYKIRCNRILLSQL